MTNTITYRLDRGSITERKRSTSAPYYCAVFNSSIAPKSKTQVLPDDVSRSYAKGDFVSAFPFTGIYRSATPMAGRVSTFTRTQPLSGSAATYCGDSAGNYVYQDADIGYYFPAMILDVPTPPAWLIAKLIAVAETKALADLQRSYYNLGVIIAERKKSISYVTDKAEKLMRLAKAKQEGSLKQYFASLPKDRRRIAKEISSEHLAFIFGLLPLIGEVKGICDLLAEESSDILTGRGRQAYDDFANSYQTLVQTDFGPTLSPISLGCTDEKLTRFSVRTSVSVKVRAASSQKLRDHGLNPLATFYDIVPLSFLCDFVSNTGTFIRSLDPLLGVDFLRGNTTSYILAQNARTVKGTTTDVSSGTNKRVVTSSGSGTSFSKALRIERKVLSTYPDPQFVFQNNLSAGKAITLAALAIQRYVKPIRALIKVREFRYRGRRPKYLRPINYR